MRATAEIPRLLGMCCLFVRTWLSACTKYAAAPQVYNYVPNQCGMVHIVVRTALPGQPVCKCGQC